MKSTSNNINYKDYSVQTGGLIGAPYWWGRRVATGGAISAPWMNVALFVQNCPNDNFTHSHEVWVLVNLRNYHGRLWIPIRFVTIL